MKTKIFLSLSLMALVACSSSPKGLEEIPADKEPEGTYIKWDKSSMQRLGNGGYCRLTRLSNSTVLVTYNNVVKHSADNGKTWGEAIEVFKSWTAEKDGKQTKVNIANLEIVELASGRLVAGCNYRPVEAEITPFAIAVATSEDKGLTWSEPQVIYEAQPRFIDGCWEPAFLQLPSGELQCYFANEGPYTESSEQQISRLSSTDDGATWGDFTTVSFREGRRDGMPVPILYNDEILVSIEDNKIGEFKPYIVKSSLSDNFSEPVLADSPNRYSALKTPLADTVYAGAPYIVAMPTGEVVLSYQTTEHRNKNWELSTMEVSISDDGGKTFYNPSRPFDVPLACEAKWNSVAVWDSTTVAALASTNFAGLGIETWLILGEIKHNDK